MSDVIMYLGTCVAGYVIAVPLRGLREKLSLTGLLQTVTTLVLVFTMGMRIGANEEVVANLGSYGVYALVFTVVIFTMSVAAVYLVRRAMKMDRYGMVVQASASGGADSAGNDTIGNAAASKASGGSKFKIDKMTLMILACVAAGILTGFFVCRRVFQDFQAFNSGAGMVITVGLCILLFFVGLDLGLDGKVLQNLRSVGLRILVIPVAIGIGSLAGAAVCSVILPVSLGESLAIGAGMGWYSLGSGILMDAGYVTAGAISFMHNVMRELFSIIFIPVVAKNIGYVESVALPGSTAMDVCLPIVERATNGNIAIYSFVSGFVLSMAVPFLVPLFL